MQRLFALFPTYKAAERALDQLRARSVGRRRLGVLLLRETLTRHLARIKKELAPRHTPGAVPGAAIGTLTGLLAGVGTVTLPDVGVVVAAGELHARPTDSVPGLLRRLGMRDTIVKRYLTALREGNVILTVRVDDDAQELRRLLAKNDGDAILKASMDGAENQA